MRAAVWLGSLDGETWWEHDADSPRYACSLVKIPIAVAAEALDLDATVVVHDEFDSVVPGERYRLRETDDQDPATWAELGGTQTLRELRRRMLVDSGNLASALVLEATGPVPFVRRGIGDEPAQALGLTNEVTARRVGRLLAQVPPAVEAVLAGQRYRDGIPAALPAGTPVANKTGWIDGLTHDAAIVRPPDSEPFALAVLTGHDGYDVVREVAREAWEHRR